MIELKKVFKSPQTSNFFQGYYDQKTVSNDGQIILACRSNFSDRLPVKTDNLEVGFFKKDNPERFQKIADTHAWNWQQGPKLQFLNDDIIVYNSIENEEYISEYRLTNGKLVNKTAAAYTISNDGTVIAAINFKRHFFFKRGYSYAAIIDHSSKAHENEYLRVTKNSTTKYLTIDNLYEMTGIKRTQRGNVLIEHPQLNSIGDKILFLLREYDGDQCFSTLCLMDLRKWTAFPVIKSGRISHYNWSDNDTFVVYGSLPTKLHAIHSQINKNNLIYKVTRQLYKFAVPVHSKTRHYITSDAYYTFDCKEMIFKKIISKMYEDGHPSFDPHSQYFVTDTYPKSGYRTLHLSSLRSNCDVSIRFFSNRETDESPVRADLHPKVDFSNNRLSVDTFAERFRGIEVYDFD